MKNYEILNAYIFKKNKKIIGTYPHNLDTTDLDLSTDIPYHNIVSIMDNKGDDGNIGNVEYSYDLINYEKKCGDCNPEYTYDKSKIESINNNNNDLTISPSIIINSNLFINNLEIRNTDSDYITINKDNIENLKELLNSNKKCDSGKQLITSDTGLGDCMNCTDAVIENSSYQPNTCVQECNDNYTYNPGENETQCIIQCGEGYKRDETNNTCEPCGIDRYKDVVNIDTSCSECPIGSTTGDNETATLVTDCTARPGYEDDDNNDNSYTLKPGNLDNIPSNGPDGTIDRCDNGYYYNNTECETCGPFGDGIGCTGGRIEYNEDGEATTYPKRKLLSGYRFSNNTSYPCEDDQYRNDDIEINHEFTSENCTTCPGGSTGNNGTEGPNEECTLLPGYQWKDGHNSPNNYDVTLKPGNNDTTLPYNGIDRCDGSYYYNDDIKECETCGPFGNGIECEGGFIENAKIMLLPGFGTREGFYNSSSIKDSIIECNDPTKYRHDTVEYNDKIPCNSCPTGSESNNENDACVLKDGYRWEDSSSSPPNYQTELIDGNLDNNTDGIIDRCEYGYYYNGTECIECNYRHGVECTGGPIDDDSKEPKRYLSPGYRWNRNTAESCDNQYRLGKKEIEDDIEINCTDCPTGTSYKGDNVCELNTGYSWGVDTNSITDNLYNVPLSSSAYYYDDDDEAIGCISDYYNIEDNVCSQCPDDEGIDCSTNRPFDQANMTLRPNYSWDHTQQTASKCLQSKKRAGNIAIEGSDITCDFCDGIPNNSHYIEQNGYQLYNDDDGNCLWECDENYTIDPNTNPNECLINCNAGYKRDENNTCVRCGVNYYKDGINTLTECSECPTGSTTGDNNTASSIDSCRARPGYEYNKSESIYKPKQGNIDNESDGIIDSCEYNYGFNSGTEDKECTRCPNIVNGGYDESETPSDCTNIICDPGYELDNRSCQPCGIDYYKDGKNKLGCSECPIGSTTNSNTGSPSIDSCTARPGYEDNDNDNIYTPKTGNVDNVLPIGEIDACGNNFYYDSTNGECVSCVNYGNGIDCTGGPINASKRILQSGYSWDDSTAEPCDDKYRLGKKEIEDSISINCTDCPIGTSYDGNNGCRLNTGYSWSDTTGDKTNNLYNDPDKDDTAYYYDDHVAEGCTSDHYNRGGNVCIQCLNNEGIDCSNNRPFRNANMTLNPNYSWNGNTATKCPKGEKREGNIAIEGSDITCNNCDNKPNNNYSQYIADYDGYQLYDTDGSCQWSCDSDYEKYHDQCLIKCDAGFKRSRDNTCVRCEADYYKVYKNTDTTCTLCPVGSTTNGNTGSTSIDSCTARPGYEYNDSESIYKPKTGNIDSESPYGIIDSCEYNYGFNSDTEDRECTLCPTISNGGYNESETLNDCSNIICNSGYKLVNRTCQPCGIDHYKDGENTSTECSECPVGSTTGDNNTATSITDCETACEGNNTYYDVTACPVNSSYQGGNCVCEEGYELNDSGDGCKSIRKLSRNASCNHDYECYSGSCVTFCQPVSLGGTCRYGSDCSTNSRCYNGKCIERLRPYDICGTTTKPCNSCLHGYYNHNGSTKCQPYPKSLESNVHCDTSIYDSSKIAPGCDKCKRGHIWNHLFNKYTCI